MNKMKQHLRSLTMVTLILVGGATQAQAETYTVNTLGDAGDGTCDATCTLRDAIAAANATVANDVIEFASPLFNTPQTILLAGTALIINNNGNLTINGPGADQLTLSGNNMSRVFTVNNGANVAISGLDVSVGNALGEGGDDSVGGGIFNDGGTLTVTDSTVSGNVATNAGGGIFNKGGTLIVTNSTVSGNSANGTSGGGIFNGFSGSLTMTNSTVSNNSAGGGGGGILNSDTGTLTMTNSTVSGNSSTFGGGGIRNGGNTITLSNSIIANSTSGGDCVNSGGTVNASYCLFEDSLSCVNGTDSNNLTGDPMLGSLQDNGGPTFTHALLSGSIAIDKGNSTLTTDQRGFSRPIDDSAIANAAGGNGSDIGAFEQPTTTILPIISINNVTQNEGNSGTTIFSFTVSLASPANAGGVTFDIATADGTGAAGSDYVARSEPNQTIVGGSKNYIFEVLVNGDTTIEADETFFVNVTNIIGATPNSVQGTGTITTDDFATQTYTVNSTNDPGDGICSAAECTLREAINAANTSPSDDTIDFDSTVFSTPQTITLTAGELAIASSSTLMINGTGADQLTVSGNNASRVFLINFGTNVTISGLTISGGNGVGSGIGYGGGISITGGTLTLSNSTVSGNSATGNIGGGISNENGTLTLNSSTISGNTASSLGGAIYNTDGTLTINNSTISGNSGGIAGGGIINVRGPLTLTNSTISGNSASDQGGGIYNSNSVLTVTNSTLIGNSAASGGGIFNFANGTVTLNNSIIANSTFGDCFSDSGTVNVSYSLVEDGSCGVINGVDNNLTSSPMLGPLQDNGGLTQTHALLPNSRAIEAGSNALISPGNTTEQRGQPRQVGSKVDLGSVEFQGATQEIILALPRTFFFDDDEDGIVNGLEIAVGRNPDLDEGTDEKLLEGTSDGGGFQLSFGYDPDFASAIVLKVTRSIDLINFDHTVTSNISAAFGAPDGNGLLTIDDPDPPADAAFYRLEAELR